ncbi:MULTISPECIES: HTTM domain-containing protein [Streptomyces]|uniref:HTTM domain-containing protein n=1 Tax=Streptomyces pratisoli TaxID=3139917 RepID=A0ACC6QB15_9ACTN|nr:HTTM domain-containing protein [Streptomyces sp. NBC_00259]
MNSAIKHSGTSFPERIGLWINGQVNFWSSYRHALIGSSLARVILGGLGFYFYLRDYAERAYLWGPDGTWPWQNFTAIDGMQGFSLYSVSKSHTWFEIIFHLGMLSALLFMLGWKTRATNVLHYVFLWSLHQRNPVLLDGGDNITAIILVFFVFIDSGARFSLDARAGKGRQEGRKEFTYRVGSVLHNAGVLAVILQICTVYLVSGMYKVQGERWQNGTALYYILRTNEFGWPGVNRLIYENATLVVAITYATVFFQLAFTFLLLNRKLRMVAVAGGIAMHLGIAFHMAGLINFSLTVVAIELIIMEDVHYLRLAQFVRRNRLNDSDTASPGSPSPRQDNSGASPGAPPANVLASK